VVFSFALGVGARVEEGRGRGFGKCVPFLLRFLAVFPVLADEVHIALVEVGYDLAGEEDC